MKSILHGDLSSVYLFYLISCQQSLTKYTDSSSADKTHLVHHHWNQNQRQKDQIEHGKKKSSLNKEHNHLVFVVKYNEREQTREELFLILAAIVQ